MGGQIFVHRVHRYELDRPHAGPRFASAALLLAYAVFFALLGGIGWSAEAPAFVSTSPIPMGLRVLLVVFGTLHAIHGTVLAVEQLQRGWAILGQRIGAFPVIESAGPCRLVQDGDHWDLRLALSQAPLWSELDAEAERSGLYFPLDEAEVAKIARIFDPGEEVAVRWVDLPPAFGGPTLLALRTAAREERIDERELRTVAAATRSAHGRGTVPDRSDPRGDSFDDSRRAA